MSTRHDSVQLESIGLRRALTVRTYQTLPCRIERDSFPESENANLVQVPLLLPPLCTATTPIPRSPGDDTDVLDQVDRVELEFDKLFAAEVGD